MSINSMAMAISRAIDHDLPDHKFTRRDGSIGTHRPHEDLISVYHFPQTWSDTSLGFGGVAGQAFTRAYTTVIVNDANRVACVYFAGRFAYLVQPINETFMNDVRNFNMAEVSGRAKYV